MRTLEIVFGSSVQTLLRVATGGFPCELMILEGLMLLGIPPGDKGNQVVIGAHSEPLRITSIGVPRDRREFGIAS